jgi:hypothetical protein
MQIRLASQKAKIGINPEAYSSGFCAFCARPEDLLEGAYKFAHNIAINPKRLSL